MPLPDVAFDAHTNRRLAVEIKNLLFVLPARPHCILALRGRRGLRHRDVRFASKRRARHLENIAIFKQVIRRLAAFVKHGREIHDDRLIGRALFARAYKTHLSRPDGFIEANGVECADNGFACGERVFVLCGDAVAIGEEVAAAGTDFDVELRTGMFPLGGGAERRGKLIGGFSGRPETAEAFKCHQSIFTNRRFLQVKFRNIRRANFDLVRRLDGVSTACGW